MCDVGWGRIDVDYYDLITCDDDEALIVYQGLLPVHEYLRAAVPLPGSALRGRIEISATLVIAPDVDPAYPNTYTRSGVELTWRPNTAVQRPGSAVPPTASFFSGKRIYKTPEYRLRNEEYKWEPSLKSTRRCNASSLVEPCFDIYYHSRKQGGTETLPTPIPYALVVHVRAPSLPSFYDEVVRAHTNVLVPLEPRIRLRV